MFLRVILLLFIIIVSVMRIALENAKNTVFYDNRIKIHTNKSTNASESSKKKKIFCEKLLVIAERRFQWVGLYLKKDHLIEFMFNANEIAQVTFSSRRDGKDLEISDLYLHQINESIFS